LRDGVQGEVMKSVAQPGESLAEVLERLDREKSRADIARILRISRRHLYRLYEVHGVAEYRRQ